jgi:hypothetical protein
LAGVETATVVVNEIDDELDIAFEDDEDEY